MTLLTNFHSLGASIEIDDQTAAAATPLLPRSTAEVLPWEMRAAGAQGSRTIREYLPWCCMPHKIGFQIATAV
jgi:hypothetical protein